LFPRHGATLLLTALVFDWILFLDTRGGIPSDFFRLVADFSYCWSDTTLMFLAPRLQSRTHWRELKAVCCSGGEYHRLRSFSPPLSGEAYGGSSSDVAQPCVVPHSSVTQCHTVPPMDSD
jgi:hypothetical protein